MRIRYAYESPDRILGTAGALKHAAPLLEERFFVLNGDSYLPIDPREPLAVFERRALDALMLVFKNDDQYGPSNTVVDDDWVTQYSRAKGERRPGMAFIDYGLRIFNKRVLELIAPDRFVDLDALYGALIAERRLAAYPVETPFHEIGSFEGLARFERSLAQCEPSVA